jgi:Mlc titration factor MtfA (ptsG expression regulator)
MKSNVAGEGTPLVLSWTDGFNVVIHEAAHRLDQLDGAMNGRPAPHPEMNPQEWQQVFTAAYLGLGKRLGRGRSPAVADSALTNPSEFFAVISEIFFKCPHALLREYPHVHRLLREFYRQEPHRRLAG